MRLFLAVESWGTHPNRSPRFRMKEIGSTTQSSGRADGGLIARARDSATTSARSTSSKGKGKKELGLEGLKIRCDGKP